MKSFTVDGINRGFVVSFKKEVQTEDSAAIKETIKSQPLADRVVLDLSQVSMITTPGLGTLVSLSKFCKDQKRRLILCGLSPYVKEVFDLTRLSPIFEIKPTREEAIRE